MTPTDFIARLRRGRAGTVYFFRGPDRLMHEECRAALVQSLPAEARAWCLADIEFERGRLERDLQGARQIPMLGGRQVLLVADAEDFRHAQDEDVAALEAYLVRPSACAIVVFAAIRADRRRRFVQLLEKKAEIVDMLPLGTREAAAWAQEFFRRAGVELDAALARELAAKFEFGGEASREAEGRGANALWMRTEMEKLLMARPAARRLAREDLDLIVAFREEHEIGKMLRALAERNLAGALERLRELLAGKVAETLILWSLAELVRQSLAGVAQGYSGWGGSANPLSIQAIAPLARQNYSRTELLRALQLVRSADLGIKSSWKDAKLLLEFLIWQIVAGKDAEAAPLALDWPATHAES